MASVRAQIFAEVEARLATVRETLEWATLLRNPREPVGEDQMNALVLLHGGEREPGSLTGHVETRALDFSVGLLVIERDGALAEELLDAGFVAVADALLDPSGIQLGGLASSIAMGAVSDPLIGRGAQGARAVGGQSIDFTVEYWGREGDASVPGP